MHILYATDGSSGALAAGEMLAGLPLASDTTITILAVLPEGDDGPGDAILESAREALRHSTASVETAVRWGHAAQEILEHTEAHPTDLIVVGTHGRSGLMRFLLGSVAERVARHAPCPVLLVRPQGRPLKQVLLAVDGSEPSDRAAEWLRNFPLPDDCEIRLFTSLPPYQVGTWSVSPDAPTITSNVERLHADEREKALACLEEMAASFKAAGKRAATELREMDASDGILQAVHDRHADLVVLGSTGRGGLERFLLGSVSERVLRHAPCSVLLVR